MNRKNLATIVALLASVCLGPLLHADDAAQRNAATEELLKAMHVDELMNTVFAQQKQAMTKMSLSFLPKDASPETVQQVQEMMPKLMDTVSKRLTWESLKPDFIQIYSEVYTEQEIKELTAFYKTPLGLKQVEKVPEISEKTMKLIQKRMPAIMAELQGTIQETIEKDKAARKAAVSPSPAAK